MDQIGQYNTYAVRIPWNGNGETFLSAGKCFHGTTSRKLYAFRAADGIYEVRFMPDEEGVWEYEISLGRTKKAGKVECVKHTDGKIHGPVRTSGCGFRYQDGTPFLSFGTTCYAWIYQNKERQAETVETLKTTCFNKLRMLLFPKWMPYNHEEPAVFPFEQDENGRWLTGRPVYAFWDSLDGQIQALADIGVEADLILFHPYDKWGLSELDEKQSLEYVSYCVARYGAYRNVWWSLANEYEVVKSKTEENWNRIGDTIMEMDEWQHPRSIHNIMRLFDKTDWMTHVSVQSGETGLVRQWRKYYRLPVVVDECGYEGDIEYGWGNLTAFDLVHRFWNVVCQGGFCAHGETFHREDEVLWWSKGGKLYGSSEPRIAFLKSLLKELPRDWENPEEPEIAQWSEEYYDFLRQWDVRCSLLRCGDENPAISGPDYILRYFGRTQPCRHQMTLSEGNWKVEVIDIWEMTRRTVLTHVSGEIIIPLPGKEGQVVLIQREPA